MPRAPKCRAISLPMPVLAPVISALLRHVVFSIFSCDLGLRELKAEHRVLDAPFVELGAKWGRETGTHFFSHQSFVYPEDVAAPRPTANAESQSHAI